MIQKLKKSSLGLVVLAFLAIPALSNGSMLDHSVAVFAGAKTVSKTTNFALGLNYEYRMGFFGIIGFAQKILSTPAETTMGAGLAVHPIPLLGLKFFAGPGIDIISGLNSAIVLRFGAAYEAHLGPIFLGPQLSFDSCRMKTATVYGLLAGIEI